MTDKIELDEAEDTVSRRKVLTRIGGAAAVAYTVPAFTTLSTAQAGSKKRRDSASSSSGASSSGASSSGCSSSSGASSSGASSSGASSSGASSSGASGCATPPPPPPPPADQI